MGRRRVKARVEHESLLTEGLLLRSLSIYGKPMPVNAIIKQMLHNEKRLGQDYKPYREAVIFMLEDLVKAGRVRRETTDSHPMPDNPGLFAVDCYFLGPLERLSAV